MICGSCLLILGFETILYYLSVAVTLDGTIIHKSGLITGGRSGIEAGAQRFKEQEVDGKMYII